LQFHQLSNLSMVALLFGLLSRRAPAPPSIDQIITRSPFETCIRVTPQLLGLLLERSKCVAIRKAKSGTSLADRNNGRSRIVASRARPVAATSLSKRPGVPAHLVSNPFFFSPHRRCATDVTKSNARSFGIGITDQPRATLWQSLCSRYSSPNCSTRRTPCMPSEGG